MENIQLSGFEMEKVLQFFEFFGNAKEISIKRTIFEIKPRLYTKESKGTQIL